MDNLETFENIDETLSINCHIIDKLELCQRYLTCEYNLKIMTLNIRSAQRNFDSFLIALKRTQIEYDVIVLTECWLHESSIIRQIDGYNVYSTTKHKNKASGVIVYVRDSFTATALEPDVEDADCILVSINGYAQIMGLYRSPSVTRLDKFLLTLDTTLCNLKENSRLVLLGDMNIDLLNTNPNADNTAYQCLMAQHGLLPAITKPTRGDKCLDHIFVRNRASKVGIVARCTVTDHDLTMVGLNTANEKPNRKKRIVMKTNYEAVSSDLQKIEWENVTNKTDVNEALECFNSIVGSAIKTHTQYIKSSRSKYNLKPWITPGLIRCMRHKDNLHHQLKQNPNNEILKRSYTRYRNFFIDILRKVKENYKNKILEENKKNAKRLWNTIKDICEMPRRKSDSSDLLAGKGTPSESLNNCNLHFTTVGKNLANQILQRLSTSEEDLAANVNNNNSPTESMFMTPTDEFEVDSVIKQLKYDSAPGLDGIKPSLLKLISNTILEPLTYICNLSISTGVFPEYWKVALVSPIYKAGPRNSPDNYRPISLLCILSKVLEKIMNNRIVKYLESNSLLSERQYGFRRGKSTTDAVDLLTHITSKHTDTGKRCLGVFLDLAKAFDTISSRILLRKLELSGIRGKPLDWLQSYMSNRRQITRINDLVSDELEISYGVPQGSILGPTLFTVYMNDILNINIPNADLICYADDTVVLFHGKDWEDAYRKAEAGMTRILKWLDMNLLTLNVKKTKYIAFRKTVATNIPTRILKIHNCWRSSSLNNNTSCTCNAIDKVEEIKYLGVIIDQHLSFKSHTTELVKRVRKQIYIMKMIRDCASLEIKRTVYIALCQSLIQYCIVIWGGAAKTNIINLERAQCAVLKTLLHKPYRYPTETLYSEASLLSVRKLFILNATSKTHISIHKRKDLSYIQTKRNFRIPTPSVNSSYAQRHPHFLHPYVYNAVNKKCDIVDCTRTQLKRKVTSWLLTLTYEDTEKLITIAKLHN